MERGGAHRPALATIQVQCVEHFMRHIRSPLQPQSLAGFFGAAAGAASAVPPAAGPVGLAT